MLYSSIPAYRRSTHALAREARFSFLLFGFELLRGLYLDLFCENILREALYSIAFAWFSVRPQYAFRVVQQICFSLIVDIGGHTALAEYRPTPISKYCPNSCLTCRQTTSADTRHFQASIPENRCYKLQVSLSRALIYK